MLLFFSFFNARHRQGTFKMTFKVYAKHDKKYIFNEYLCFFLFISTKTSEMNKISSNPTLELDRKQINHNIQPHSTKGVDIFITEIVMLKIVNVAFL